MSVLIYSESWKLLIRWINEYGKTHNDVGSVPKTVLMRKPLLDKFWITRDY